MDEKKEKAHKIVKSIKLLEGVLKTSKDGSQKARVKKDIENFRAMLKEMYPEADLAALEDAIFSDSMVITHKDEEGFQLKETLRGIEIERISPFRNDEDINLSAGIMKYFEERIWGVIADQHTKLDFSNSGIRDALYRKLDQCNRSLKMFTQTVADIDKAKSPDYSSQLQLMRTKQGRVFLYDFKEFLSSAKSFVASLVNDAEHGGSMILNPDDRIVYADYEKYREFENRTVIEAVRHLSNFISDALDTLNIPDIKNLRNPVK